MSFLIKVEGQDVKLKNPSFEGEPRRGIIDAYTLEPSGFVNNWTVCRDLDNLGHSPPDIHSATQTFWDAERREVPDGETYLVLVTREDDSYEYISQELEGFLRKDSCYRFSITLAQSQTYLSPTRRNKQENANFDEPIVLKIWGSNDVCYKDELLSKSEIVDHHSWEKYSFDINPTRDYSYITFEAFFSEPTMFGYNGNICLDNASSFRQIECDDELIFGEE